MNKKIKILLHLLGPAIFIYILFQIDFGLLGKELLNVNIIFLILAAFFVAVQIATRAQKWRVILLGTDISLKRIKAVNLYWLGTFVGIITPGKLGELIKVYFLKNKGYNGLKSFLSVLFDRIADVLILLLFGFLIFVFFLREIGIYISVISIAILFLLIVIFMLINKKSFLHKIFFKFLKRFSPLINIEKYDNYSFSQFFKNLRKIKKRFFLSFIFYLLISWFFYFVARYCISLSMGLGLSFLDISIISVLTAIVTMLPVSVAGLGTREAAVIYLFSLFSLNKETALLFSLLIFTIDLIVVSFGLIPYLKESFLIKDIKKQID